MVRQLYLFFISLFLSLAGFTAFVYLFPFPRESEQEIISTFVHWVATRTSLYTPYKYWWPLGVIVPLAAFVLWHALSFFTGKRLRQIGYIDGIPQEQVRFKPREIGVVSLILLFLLVNFAYSYYYMFFYNYHHLNFITGPINDVIHGKFLLVDTKAQYGFLNIFLASLLFKYVLYFSHANIHFVSMIFGFVEYLTMYMILRILLNNKPYALLSIFFIMALHFYGVFPDLFSSELYVWPGGSGWRFFPVMPTALFLLMWLRTGGRKWFYAAQAGVAVSLLWNTEAGISVLLGYCAALAVYAFYLQESIIQKGYFLLHSVVSLLLILLLMMSVYSCYIYFSIGRWPDWSGLLYYTRLFNSGFLQSKGGAPPLGLSYWPVLMYGIISILAMLRAYIRFPFSVRNLVFLSFIAVYGYFMFRYYIGKQYSSDLAAVIVPAGIIFSYLSYCYFFTVLPFVLSTSRNIALTRLAVLVWFILAGFFVYQQGSFLYWSYRLFRARVHDLNILRKDPAVNYPPKNRIIAVESSSVPTTPFSELLATTRKIREYVSGDEPVAILGTFDHVLLMQSGKTNLAPYWDIHATLYTKEEVNEVTRLFATQPEYLFLDKQLLRKNATDYVTNPMGVGERVMLEIFRRVRPHYIFEEDIGMVYVYRRK